jgi:SpoIIAA-like
MSIQFTEENDGKILVIHIIGKLAKADYGYLLPKFEHLVREHGKLRLLFDLNLFQGWKLCGLWEDIKFYFKHFAHIERLAMVGDTKWQGSVAIFCKPFTKATVRSFGHAQCTEAREWLYEP